MWFVGHVRSSDRIFDEDLGHSTLTIHIDASVWGMRIWSLSEKKEYHCPLPHEVQTSTISSMRPWLSTVQSTLQLHWGMLPTFALWLTIQTPLTPSGHSVSYLTTTLSSCQPSTPSWNTRSTSMLSTFQECKCHCGCFVNNKFTTRLVSGLCIHTFQPPWDVFGAAKNDLNLCNVLAGH